VLNPREIYVGFVVDQVALRQIFLQVLQFPFVLCHSLNARTWWNRPISSCSAKKFLLAYHNNNNKKIYNAQGAYFSEGKMVNLGKQTTHKMDLMNDDNNNNNKY